MSRCSVSSFYPIPESLSYSYLLVFIFGRFYPPWHSVESQWTRPRLVVLGPGLWTPGVSDPFRGVHQLKSIIRISLCGHLPLSPGICLDSAGGVAVGKSAHWSRPSQKGRKVLFFITTSSLEMWNLVFMNYLCGAEVAFIIKKKSLLHLRLCSSFDFTGSKYTCIKPCCCNRRAALLWRKTLMHVRAGSSVCAFSLNGMSFL